MEKKIEQKSEEPQRELEKKGKVEEGLPAESSPYTQYKDLEDYNQQGYGAEGHQEPKPGRGGGGGSTDAPTPSGSGAPTAEAQLSTTDVVNRQGIP